MADNYLERKMEEYRRGNTPRSAVRMPVFAKAGTVNFEIGIKKAFVSGFEHNMSVAAGIVEALRGCGMSVSFAWTAMDAGRKLSHSTGSRHYPMQVSRALAAGATAGVDIMVAVDENSLAMAYGGKRTLLGFAPVAGTDVLTAAIGKACLYLLLPQSAMLRGRVLGMDADGTLTEISPGAVEV